MEKIKKISKLIAIGGLFLLPFIPLVVSSSMFFPFITAKNFLFRIITEIVLLAWLILFITDKRYSPKKSQILIFVFLFTFGLTISTIFGENIKNSFWSNFERMEGLITYLHLMAYFIVLTSVLKTEKLWKWFFGLNIGVGIITALYGVVQLLGKAEIHQGGVRLDASLGNASYFAILMVFNIFLCLLFLFRESGWKRWVFAPVIVLETVVLYYTATRGSILGFILGMFLMGVFLLFSKSRKIKITAIVAVSSVLLLVVVFLFARNSNFIQQSPVLSRFGDISLSETTTSSRIIIWSMAWEGFKEKPVLGWGPENFDLIFNKYYRPELWPQEPWFDRAHNVFFDRLTTGGIIGLVTYLGLFFSAIFVLWFRKQKTNFSLTESAIFTSVLLAYFANNFFVFDNITSSLIFFGILAYIHFRSSSKEEGIIDTNKEIDITKITASILVACFVIIIFYFNAKGCISARNLISAFKEVGSGNAGGAFEKFKKTIEINSFGTKETREHLSSFAISVISSPEVPEETKAKIYNFSVEQMELQVEETPNNIRELMFLAILLNKGRQYDMAIDVLKRAADISPSKQQIYFEMGTSYLNLKKYDLAINVLKKAFELDKSYPDARKIYAMALIMGGHVDEANIILKEGFGTNIVPDDRLLRAYYLSGDYKNTVSIMLAIISKDPGNYENHVNLGALYSEMGQINKAVESLKKAIELNPSFKEQGEYYIKQIQAGIKP